jgi:type II secretory pathway pseudopilin PulG
MATGSRERGFTYLSALLLVALSGLTLVAFAGAWSHAAQREKERELVFAGEQFRQAIALYYWRTPGGAHQYPKSLDDLLEDKRWPTTQRYLRRLYRDPITNTSDWGVVEAPGAAGIMGVYSKSTDAPIRTTVFPEARNYTDWKFVFVPETPRVPAQQAGR